MWEAPGPERGEAWALRLAASSSRGALRAWAERRAGAEGLGWFSLETQQAFYEQELRNDETDTLDRLDPGTSALQILLQSGVGETAARRAACEAGLQGLLERGYRLLSTGESRLLLLLREVLAAPPVLVLEQPFDGLDAGWRATADQLMGALLARGGRLVVLVDRWSDVPRCATHWGVWRETHSAVVVPRGASGGGPLEAPQELSQLLHLESKQPPALPEPPTAALALPEPLVRMQDCGVFYHVVGEGRVAQFAGLNWELRQGEHTLVTGPNGAGKSTLLQLLSGDHPQSYNNDLYLFGHQRGSGESVWDIKKHVGLVSPALHRDYRAGGNLASVVLSGLYDSIGLYREAPESDRRLALRWLEVLGLADCAGARFGSLSWGQQRLVLIARGLIKHPPLLILDEPTQGLDELGRQLVLAFIQQLASLQRTTLLLVTHRPDEHLALFTRRLMFHPSSLPRVRFEIRVA